MWPGLIGSELDIDTGNYLTYDFGWHAGIDSFFEVSTDFHQASQLLPLTYYPVPHQDILLPTQQRRSEFHERLLGLSCAIYC